jgi:O-antigen ligase
MFSLIHPSLSAESDFLGYVQPRPTAPFAYANAWGNNTGTYLPFFILAWFARDAGWRRRAAPLVLALAVIPLAYSLNRGLWAGLALAGLLFAIRMALSGRIMVLASILVGAGLAGSLFVLSPLYDTVTLRIETPHSNDRRATVAEEVIGKTWEGSPLLGYASTRTVQGSFSSIAGGETESCHQCAAPPLGTQGFLWRLIFTTGLVGTVLYLGFVIMQLLRYIRGRDPLNVTCCIVIMMSLLYFMVYDSLESPLFTLMIAIGLLNRRSMVDIDRRWKDPANTAAVP